MRSRAKHFMRAHLVVPVDQNNFPVAAPDLLPKESCCKKELATASGLSACGNWSETNEMSTLAPQRAHPLHPSLPSPAACRAHPL